MYEDKGIDLGTLIDGTKDVGLDKFAHARGDIDANKMIDMKCADIYVELTPTNVVDGEPGYSFIRRILANGCHAVTSNKGPVVLYYNELRNLASENNVKFLYEATVGGAMPVLNLVRESLLGNDVVNVCGILNGTTNYILTRMGSEGAGFSQILKEAQEMGIAEADPSYDVDGVDAAAKAVIIANEFFSKDAHMEDVDVCGITRITPEFVALADKNGFSVKLIVEVGRDVLRVAPRLIAKSHPLCVDGVLNAVSIKVDMAREVTVVGYGAGKYETAGAVISDILSV